MGSRPVWKGALRISLVTVPVRMFTATASENAIRFNQLHRECGARLKQKKWCTACETEAAGKDEIVRGYEHDKGQFVIIGDDELAAAQPASTKIIDLQGFAPSETLDAIYVDRAYYLAPDGSPHGKTFRVIKDALEGRMGIGKLAMAGKECRVVIRNRGEGLVLYTLHRSNDVRSMRGITELEAVPEESNPAEVELASRLMDTMATEIDFSAFDDAYEKKIRELIAAKVRGEEPVFEEPADDDNVVDLVAALRGSLGEAELPKAS